MLDSLQRRLIYRPRRSNRLAVIHFPDLSALYQSVSDLELTTPDAVTLKGWLLRTNNQPETATAERAAILYFHGNAGHRGNRVPWYRVFHKLATDVLAVDYRGYGDSDGSPTESGLILDAQTTWRYATETLGYSAGRIWIVGSSLGGAVAVRLAADLCRRGVVPAGLIGVATFSSLTDVAAAQYPWLPVRWLLVDRFESHLQISDVACAYLHLHGDRDDIVPLSCGRKLFEAAPNCSADGKARRFVVLPGLGHDNVLPDAAETVIHELNKFVTHQIVRTS